MICFPKKSFRDVPLDSSVVLVRVDYNVPQQPDGEIADDFRIRASLPTIEALRKRNCKIVLCSHLGRPDGKVVPQMSLEIVAHRLIELLHVPVRFVNDCVGDKVSQAVSRMKDGDILLLENLRFYAEEEANDMDFAGRLARDSHAAFFVQDGFAVVHRAHASTVAVTQYLPSSAGLLLEKEYCRIVPPLEHPKRPLVAILGGAKISDKIGVVERFVQIADTIVIGGAMANTFLAYNDKAIGNSKTEKDSDEIVRKIYESARAKTGNVDEFLILPTDVAVTKNIRVPNPEREVVSVDDVKEDDIIVDIGDQTIAKIESVIETAQTVVWNGTLGITEVVNFSHGSGRVALSLARHKDSIESIVGGGDTAEFIMAWDGHDGASFGHVSTGGGASIELMSGASLPGIDALMDA